MSAQERKQNPCAASPTAPSCCCELLRNNFYGMFQNQLSLRDVKLLFNGDVMNLADAPLCLLNSTWGRWSGNKYPCGDDHVYLWGFMKNSHLQKTTEDSLPSPKFYHWFMTGTFLKITLFDKVTRAEGKHTQIILFLTLISICLGKDFSSFEQSVICFRPEGFWPIAGVFTTALSSSKWSTSTSG